ncbi:hypothetical protein [Bounagaea algeriensis]
MWTTGDRLDPRDAYAPCESEIGLTLAQAFEAGEAIDATDSALRSGDIYSALDPYVLAAARTDTDAEHLAAAFEASLTTAAAPAEVVDLAARRRRATPTGPQRGRQRVA